MAEKTRVGEWVESGVLGHGSFGIVSLWQNEETKEKIAVKTCRNTIQMSGKNRERWKKEVKFLKELDHPNVIQTLPLPEALQSYLVQTPLPLPALCMEYCEGGDLRKTLSTAENCCGLKETMTLKVCGDIASAMQCLHQKNIAHRDLKPENIVISMTGNKMICKVIDLGYAKELDQSSSHHSIVGTQFYLAPEIVTGGKYTTTVDYWSFGCLMFECCTGSRPFPMLRDFFKSIGNKEHHHISVTVDDEQENIPKFSKSLPEVNRLNSVLQPKFVELLRLLLDGDPRRRGYEKRDAGNRSWFDCVQGILATKVIEVFFIEMCTQYFYELSSNFSVSELRQKIEKDTGIAEDEQELFLLDGSDVTSSSSLRPGVTVFVFNRAYKQDKRRDYDHQVPCSVLEMLYDHERFSNYKMKRHVEVYKHSLFFVQKQILNIGYLLRGLKALVIRLLKWSHERFYSKCDRTLEKMTQLKSVIDFYKSSLDFDLRKYNFFCDSKSSAGRNGLSRELGGVESWKIMQSELDGNNILEESRKIFEEKTSLQARITAVKTNELVSGKRPQKSFNLLTKRADELQARYEQLKKNGDDRLCWKEKIGVLRHLIKTFLDEKMKIEEEFYMFLSELFVVRKDLNEFIPKVEKLENKTTQLSREIEEKQQKRQEQIWGLCISNEEKVVEKGPPGRIHYKRSTSGVVKQSQSLVARVKETLQSVQEQQESLQYQAQCLDWTFCDLSDIEATDGPP